MQENEESFGSECSGIPESYACNKICSIGSFVKVSYDRFISCQPKEEKGKAVERKVSA
jgi:hypothetical protein